MTKQMASGVDMNHWFYIRRRLRERGVEMITSATVEEVKREAILLKVGEETKKLSGIEAIILAVGVRSKNELFEPLKEASREVQAVGDAREPRNALEAALDGAKVGAKI